MAEKEYLRKLFVFQPYECAAVEELLTKMASEGWMLESIKGRAFAPYVFVFHKVKPQKIRFTVDYFQWGSIYEEKPLIQTQEYIEYCLKDGWRHVCTKGKMQVFCTEDENIVPIQTDEHTKFIAINKAFTSQNFYTIPVFLMLLLSLSFQINSNFENLITLNSRFLNAIINAFALIMITFMFIEYLRWRIQAKKDLKTTGKMHLESRKKWFTPLHLYFIFFLNVNISLFTALPDSIIAKLMFLGFVISLGYMLTYRFYFEKRNYSKNMNRIISAGRLLVVVFMFSMLYSSFLFYSSHSYEGITDQALEDIVESLPTEESNGINFLGDLPTGHQETFLAQMNTYEYAFKMPGKFGLQYLNVYIFESPHRWINKKFIRDRIDGNKYDFNLVEEDPASWGVDSLYRMDGDNNSWKDVIVFEDEDKVFVLESEIDIDYTSEDIKSIINLY